VHTSVARWYYRHSGCVAGLDEAGRGPLAGPVVAAAVVLRRSDRMAGLDDSKVLTEIKREKLYSQIRQKAIAYAIVSVSHKQIDDLNILRASLRAMQLAFLRVERRMGQPLIGALTDGNQKVPLPERVLQHTIVGGDGLFPPIMAASILAKVYRDRLMRRYARYYPKYGFEQHKGYYTPQHADVLARLGPTPIHRRSFAPVRAALQQNLTW